MNVNIYFSVWKWVHFLENAAPKSNIILMWHMIRGSLLPPMKSRLCLFFLLITASVHGQMDYITNMTERADTALINRYLKRSNELNETKHDSVNYYLNQALLKSYTYNYSKGIVSSLTELSVFNVGSSTDLAIKYGNTALYEFNSRHMPNFRNVKYRIYNALARAYEIKGMVDSSAYFFYLLNDAIEEGRMPDNSYFALATYTQLAMFWLGSNWDINGGYVEPTQYFINKAKQVEKMRTDSISDLSYISYMLQGVYYSCIGNYDSSRYYHLQYLHLREKYKLANATWDAATYLNIAQSYLYQNKPGEAIYYIERELAMKKELASSPRYLIMGNLALAKAYFQQKKYPLSVETFEHTWDNFDRNDFSGEELMDAYKVAADSYEAIGQLPKSLEYKNTYIRLHDSLMKKEKVDMMNRLHLKYRISEKDKALTEQRLATAQAENRVHQKNVWIAGISFVAVFITALFVLWQRINRHKQNLQQEKINSFQQQMAIEKLNAAIAGEERERTRIARELHDGIGGLMAGAKMNFEIVKKAYHLDNEADFKDGLQLLEDASVELRKTAHNMMPEILLQEGLAVAIEHFCRKVASNSSTRIFFQTSGDIRSFPPHFELSVYRVVQELVHNILKHAQATEAIVQMAFSNDIFTVTVEDNGVGLPPGIMATAKGMGLRSIADRLKTINGRIEIQNLPENGTSIYLEVSLENENITA